MIRNATIQDSKKICEIYNYYIENSIVTFEEEKITAAEIENRMKTIQEKFFWIVYEEENEIKGYAYITSFKGRSAYNKSVECSIYVDNNELGKGIGTALFMELLNRVKALNLHVLLSCITIPNEKSEILHNKFGFEKVAHFKEVGYKFERWIDVSYWQLILNN